MKNKLIFLTTLISVISLTACSFIRKHKIDSSDVTSTSSSIYSEHEHIPGSPVSEGRVEPTCTEDGYYYSVVYCTECHKELSRERITLEHLGHDIQIGQAHTPTCEEAGWEEYVLADGLRKELFLVHDYPNYSTVMIQPSNLIIFHEIAGQANLFDCRAV